MMSPLPLMLVVMQKDTGVGWRDRTSSTFVCFCLSQMFLVSVAFGGFLESTSLAGVFKDYCEAETFKATCPTSQVILVRKALYGRMKVGRCVFRDYGYTGCSADVGTHMDVMCSGSRSCEVRIPDATLDRVNPCPKDFKTYLEVSYDCITVHMSNCSCDNESTVLPVKVNRSGYISGHLNGSECRHHPCPLLLRVPKGQRINISLWDFTLEEHERDQMKKQMLGVETCYRYGTIFEKSRSREVDVCGGWSRLRHIYTSQGNLLEIHLLGTLVKNHRPKFLLQYEAIGCTDFEPPSNSWTRRHEMSVDVNCQNGGSSYRVVCLNNEWVGSVGVCPDVGSGAAITENVIDEATNAPGLFISVVICLAFVTGAIILTIGLIILHRHRVILELSRPANQKSGNWQTQFTSAGDVSAMSSINHDGCYNEVTYTPSLTSPTQGGRETPCLCQTILSEHQNSCDYGRPTIELCQMNCSSGLRLPEPIYCRGGSDLTKTLIFNQRGGSSPRCLPVLSPGGTAFSQYLGSSSNSPRAVHLSKSEAPVEYVLACAGSPSGLETRPVY